MSNKKTIFVEVEPENPVQYLACCGLFEIAARFDAGAYAFWSDETPSRFVLEISLEGATLVDVGDLAKLGFILPLEISIEEATLVYRVVTAFANARKVNEPNPKAGAEVTKYISLFKVWIEGEKKPPLLFDWWYETLKKDSEHISKESEIINNSAWKLWGGNQSVSYYFQGLFQVCEMLKDKTGQSLTELLALKSGADETDSEVIKQEAEISGQGFGFDPRAARNDLDVGYSPNIIKQVDKEKGKVTRYPFAEVLALVGIQYFFPPRTQYFFPPRTHEAGQIVSTRGWLSEESQQNDKQGKRGRRSSEADEKKQSEKQRQKSQRFFRYGLWHEAVPITIARVLAAGMNEGYIATDFYCSLRVSRNKWSNLAFATPTE